ncbi:MAG TPA: PAS domain-containing protein, partial [Azonexus sp.]|nr:PAS domain-containing protein [Azonexus sp.]
MDTATLLSTNALLSSAATVIMFVVLQTRKTYPGFGFWTAGVACLALGAAMLVPGALPQTWIVRVLRNAMLLGGLLLLLRGMLIFRGFQVSYRWEALFALLFLVVFGYYSLDPAQLDARIVIYCILAGVLSLTTAILTLRYRPPYFGSNDVMLALWLLVFSILSFVRIAHELSHPNVSTAFEALKGFGSLYAVAQILTVQLVTLTLISMNSQRIEYEYSVSESRLRDSEAQVRSIGDNLPDGFVYQFEMRDGKRVFSYISAGVEKMLGLNPTELMMDAQPLFALMAPDSYAQYLEDEARCLREL